jgi:hypothetical protein
VLSDHHPDLDVFGREIDFSVVFDGTIALCTFGLGRVPGDAFLGVKF